LSLYIAPTWLEVASREVGVTETPGAGNTPRVLEYHRSTNLAARAAGRDETPWCSSFVNWCLEEAGWVGTDSAAARSWLRWGLELPEPWLGCVVVIRAMRGGPDASTGSSSGNHVAFYKQTPYTGAIELLGGNQSDQVKVSTFSVKSYEVLGLRWPAERR
jgi:uncharacterized protein (TIGR02594 family)